MIGSLDVLLQEIGTGLPDSVQYRRLCAFHIETPPAAAQMARLDPFCAEYRGMALDIYLSLRGRAEDGYAATRDEAAATSVPESLWTDLIPWSFRDAAAVSEHLLAWGQIFRHAALPKGGSVLEYGPGSGQILLMLARLGYRACGVDIDASTLQAIDAQARHLGLQVETEVNIFGDGFAADRFDCIVFYEAFHHALEFEELLLRLHARLKPGGRVILCGEPIVPVPNRWVPYPWGPRLDGLSVFCIRRFGWMELGFTHDCFKAVAKATGWRVTTDRSQKGRAITYVLEPERAPPNLDAVAALATTNWSRSRPNRITQTLLRQVRATFRSPAFRTK